MTTVALRDVTKIFTDGTVAVDNATMEVGSGEFLVLLGPSGCGKSTVLRMIAGLEEPSGGEVILNGDVANHIPPQERRVAMVFQDFALYPHMTVAENIGFPLRLSGVEPRRRTHQVAEVAGALGIGDVLDRRPGQLSGGQRQRVAMGRAIVRKPGLFLMDEPLSNLDSGLRAELRAEISGLVRELGVTCVYVTHDQAEALTMADRVAIMRKGVLQDVGPPTQVYGRPATLYVAAFLGSPRMNLLEATVHVALDRYVALRLGEQALYLQWNDLRARHIAHFHGERIVVGIRAEALAPVSPDNAGDVLHGRVRYLEHHGHESLAFLDIGATAVVVDEMAGQHQTASDSGGTLRRLVSRITGRNTATPAGGADEGAEIGGTGIGGTGIGGTGIGGTGGTYDGDSGELAMAGRTAGIASHNGKRSSVPVPEPVLGAARHHRRPAELAVRLAPYPAVTFGHPLTVSVRMDALHFFDDHGKRIDVGWH